MRYMKNIQEMNNHNSERICPYCKEEVKLGAQVCPHCKRTIFHKNPGANALVGVLLFIISFVILYFAINAFAKYQAAKDYEQAKAEAQKQYDELLK